MAQWAIKNGVKRVATLVSDFAPGLETEKAFVDEFRAKGGDYRIVARSAAKP
jgi:branched-chain amino acid transport system substrate-binding protein